MSVLNLRVAPSALGPAGMLTTEVLIADLKGEEKMAAAAASYGGAYEDRHFP
jgi:hypothetical protein